MKICVLTKYYGQNYTGATTSTYNLIENWINLGVEVVVITSKIVGKTNKQAKVLEAKGNINLLTALKRIKMTNKKIWGYSDDHLGFLFSVFNISYIHTYHGNWPQAMFHTGFIGIMKGAWFIPQYGLTLKKCELVGCVSKFSTIFIKKFNSNFQLIRNGVNVEPIPKKETLILDKKLKIIMVGGVDNRKYESLLSLLKSLNESTRQNISIDVYGQEYDKGLVKKLSKTNIVKFKGFVSSIPYTKYDLFLSTSVAENLSIASIESIISGVPVLGFRVGGMGEIIKNGRNGILIQNGDVLKMQDTLEKIANSKLKFNFDNCMTIKEFSWKETAKQYLYNFEKLNNSFE